MKNGFTLIELLVVIALVGITVSIVMAISQDINKKYEICHIGGVCYYTNSYKEKDNCIITDSNLKICGDYTIQENPQEE